MGLFSSNNTEDKRKVCPSCRKLVLRRCKTVFDVMYCENNEGRRTGGKDKKKYPKRDTR